MKSTIKYEMKGEAPSLCIVRVVNGEAKFLTRFGSKIRVGHYTSTRGVNQAIANALTADRAACTRLGLKCEVGATWIEVG